MSILKPFWPAVCRKTSGDGFCSADWTSILVHHYNIRETQRGQSECRVSVGHPAPQIVVRSLCHRLIVTWLAVTKRSSSSRGPWGPVIRHLSFHTDRESQSDVLPIWGRFSDHHHHIDYQHSPLLCDTPPSKSYQSAANQNTAKSHHQSANQCRPECLELPISVPCSKTCQDFNISDGHQWSLSV